MNEIIKKMTKNTFYSFLGKRFFLHLLQIYEKTDSASQSANTRPPPLQQLHPNPAGLYFAFALSFITRFFFSVLYISSRRLSAL